MRKSKLFLEMCNTSRWQNMIYRAEEKGIDQALVNSLCFSSKRNELLEKIYRDEYTIFPPHVAKIPKDEKGKFRTVYINEGIDRILLTLINDCLCDLFPEMVHPNCVSYQKGIGTQKIVKKISSQIVQSHLMGQIGWKSDFSKYFDTVKIETIDAVFDILEKKLGFEKNTEPVINLLRRYYHQDIYFDENKNVQIQYQGLKQGCAVASFLANACLYDLDDYMSKKYKIYYRYSDDVVVIDKNTKNVIKEMNTIIAPHGVSLNPKKVEPLYHDKWFKFLGFLIKGEQITLSPRRVKKFQTEIDNLTRHCKTAAAARRQIVRYLYHGEHSWASSCLGIINVQHDIDELNSYLMSVVRACATGKRRIGGIGTSLTLKEGTIVRGRGRNVSKNKEKLPHIDKYISVQGFKNALNICPEVYETVVREVMR